MEPRPELPRVAGVGGGVGTTTLTAAVWGADQGVYRGGRVDLLVARSTLMSLGAAQLALAAAPDPPPLLAVVADQARGGVPTNAAHRLRMTEPLTAGVFHVPFVEAWRDLEYPPQSAQLALSGRLAEQLRGRSAREFARVIHDIVSTLIPRLAHHLPTGPARPGSRALTADATRYIHPAAAAARTAIAPSGPPSHGRSGGSVNPAQAPPVQRRPRAEPSARRR